jgi:hypothetical protein
MCFIFLIMVMNKVSPLAGKGKAVLLFTERHMGVVASLLHGSCVEEIQGSGRIGCCPRIISTDETKPAELSRLTQQNCRVILLLCSVLGSLLKACFADRGFSWKSPW